MCPGLTPAASNTCYDTYGNCADLAKTNCNKYADACKKSCGLCEGMINKLNFKECKNRLTLIKLYWSLITEIQVWPLTLAIPVLMDIAIAKTFVIGILVTNATWRVEDAKMKSVACFQCIFVKLLMKNKLLFYLIKKSVNQSSVRQLWSTIDLAKSNSTSQMKDQIHFIWTKDAKINI